MKGASRMERVKTIKVTVLGHRELEMANCRGG